MRLQPPQTHTHCIMLYGHTRVRCTDMPAKPRNNRVELRLTELEKKDWSEAAGGTRKLSDWIRAQCNSAARLARDENGAVVAKPVIVEDAIRRSIGEDASVGAYERHKAALEREDQAHRESRPLPATETRGADSSSGDRKSVGAGVKASAPSACPRAWAHRPGTYCGACKRVIAK